MEVYIHVDDVTQACEGDTDEQVVLSMENSARSLAGKPERALRLPIATESCAVDLLTERALAHGQKRPSRPQPRR